MFEIKDDDHLPEVEMTQRLSPLYYAIATKFQRFELHVFPVLHLPFRFPVENDWISAGCDIVSSSGDFEVLEKLAKQPRIRSHR